MSTTRRQDEQQQNGSDNIAEFMKFVRVGQSVMGKVERFFTTSNGRALLLCPVIVYDSEDDGGTSYHSIAVGLGAHLRSQIGEDDDEIGRWLRITFTGEQPIAATNGRKLSPRKLFKVDDLSFSEAGELGRHITDSANRDNPFRNMASRQGDGEQDNLPF